MSTERYHMVPWGTSQMFYAEAAVLVEQEAVKWISGHLREDQDTWYSDERYLVIDDEKYDEMMRKMRHQYAAFPDYDSLPQSDYKRTFDWAIK